MNIWQGIRYRLKHGLMTRSVLSQLRRVGLGVRPYIVYREPPSQPSEAELSKLDLEQISLENLDRVIECFSGEQFVKRHWWERRLRDGEIGFLMTEDAEFVGYTWVNLNRCGRLGLKIKLNDNQAYLTDTYVAKRARGRGMAVLLRQHTRSFLEKRGRSEFFSVSEYFNLPAKNFKKHLRAEPLELRIALQLFWLPGIDVRLRSYGDVLVGPAWAKT